MTINILEVTSLWKRPENYLVYKGKETEELYIVDVRETFKTRSHYITKEMVKSADKSNKTDMSSFYSLPTLLLAEKELNSLIPHKEKDYLSILTLTINSIRLTINGAYSIAPSRANIKKANKEETVKVKKLSNDK